MKYKTGDRFIIEIWNEVKPHGLYTVKGFNTLVFDDNGLDRLEQVQEHDGCKGCEYELRPVDDEHCSQCCHNYRLQWTPKKTVELQVGDEVVEHDYGIKAVVYAVTDYVYGMYKNERGAIVRDE